MLVGFLGVRIVTVRRSIELGQCADGFARVAQTLSCDFVDAVQRILTRGSSVLPARPSDSAMITVRPWPTLSCS